MDTPIQNEDLYKLLNIDENATEKEITKAYRTAALKVHPDKNPDDPLAAQRFRRLSEALQLLTDAAARAAYDKVRRGRQAAAERARALGVGRRRFKEQLEAAEAAAAAAESATSASGRSRQEDEASLEREKQRLRRELNDVLAREQELLRQELRQAAADKDKDNLPTIKLTWRGDQDDCSSQSEASLKSLCSSFGEVVTLLYRPGKASSKKSSRGGSGGVAIVEFRRHDDADRLVKALTAGQVGLSAVWLQGQKQQHQQTPVPPAASAATTGDWLPTNQGRPSGDWLRKVTADDLIKMFSRGKRAHPGDDKNSTDDDNAASAAPTDDQ